MEDTLKYNDYNVHAHLLSSYAFHNILLIQEKKIIMFKFLICNNSN